MPESLGLKTSVVIPCVSDQLPLLEKLLQLYAQQSVVPNEVVVALSECQKISSFLIDALEHKPWPFALKMLRISQKCSTAKSRNDACAQATGDLFICQDLDTVPHPQRVEVIRHLFTTCQLEHLLHQGVSGSTAIQHYTAQEAVDACRRFRIYEQIDVPNVHNRSAAFLRSLYDRLHFSPLSGGQEEVAFNRMAYVFCTNKAVLQWPLLANRFREQICEAKGKTHVVNGQTYDDDTVADLITIITTTNPIPIMPSTRIIREAQESLCRIPALAKCKKVIVFDGIQPWFENRVHDYEEYKRRVAELAAKDPSFAKTELVFCPSWMHIAGAVREAMKRVSTPYIFIHQHDFRLEKTFDLNGVIASMAANPRIKHVRLAYGETNTAQAGHDGPVDEVIEGLSFIPLSRTFGWSDNDHVSRLDYYLEFVLPQSGFGGMEETLHPAMKKALAEFGISAHERYGTYLYGPISDGGYLDHLHGRGASH